MSHLYLADRLFSVAGPWSWKTAESDVML